MNNHRKKGIEKILIYKTFTWLIFKPAKRRERKKVSNLSSISMVVPFVARRFVRISFKNQGWLVWIEYERSTLSRAGSTRAPTKEVECQLLLRSWFYRVFLFPLHAGCSSRLCLSTAWRCRRVERRASAIVICSNCTYAKFRTSETQTILLVSTGPFC